MTKVARYARKYIPCSVCGVNIAVTKWHNMNGKLKYVVHDKCKTK